MKRRATRCGRAAATVPRNPATSTETPLPVSVWLTFLGNASTPRRVFCMTRPGDSQWANGLVEAQVRLSRLRLLTSTVTVVT